MVSELFATISQLPKDDQSENKLCAIFVHIDLDYLWFCGNLELSFHHNNETMVIKDLS